jgi:hypothetical protein
MISFDTFKNLSVLYIFFSLSYYLLITKNYYYLYYYYHQFFEFVNETLYSGVMYEQIYDSENEEDNKKEHHDKKESTKEMKYEDKYLEDIRKMDKEYKFNEEELKLIDELFPKFFKDEIEKPNFIKKDLNDKINNLNNYIKKILDEDFSVNSDDEDENFDKEGYKMILINDTNNEIKKFNSELEELDKNIKSNDEIEKIVNEKIKQYIIDKKLNELKNCYIIEKTPLGNVIMVYNHSRDTFEYYSDNSIPYRYLEPVCRKYVKTYNCRYIYVDMEEELKDAEKKLKEKEEQEKIRLEEEQKNKQENKPDYVSKKNVFAKFKSYNREAGSGRVNTVAPPKNSIPNHSNTKDNNEKVLLKERANRYSHEGRFSNFNILKKTSRKVVDKKYAMSFADFKKIQASKLNKNNN